MHHDKNHKQNSLEGDRGLPNVNHNPSNLIKGGMIKILAVLGMIITLGFAYLSYVKSNKPEHKNAQKNLQITDVVPARTFELPAQKKDISQKNQTMNSSKPLDDNPLEIIDKSGAALMASKETPVTHSSEDTNTNQRSANTALSELLTATATSAQSASVLKNRDYLLPKGSLIDCVLQTRLDSTLPGMTACVVTRNIYGDTGKVLLVERGSIVTGEYQSNMKQGQARIFVLWNRIKTPNGIVINLDSPGTDALGGAGLPGYVDAHFFQRFGGAILLSLIQDAGAAGANALSSQSDTTITLNNTSGASQTLALEALKNTINIPPTLYKNQGDRLGIYVARDLSFKTVYDLKPE